MPTHHEITRRGVRLLHVVSNQATVERVRFAIEVTLASAAVFLFLVLLFV